MRSIIRWAILALLAGSGTGLQAEAATPATRFAELKTLAGDWTGKAGNGREWRLNYKLIANDSVLVETWKSTTGKETMTVYHMDGGRLLATHYCGQGNQPRLELAQGSRERMDFRMVDITNLQSPDDSHQHAFSVQIVNAAEIRKSETYLSHGKEETEMLVFKRVSG